MPKVVQIQYSSDSDGSAAMRLHNSFTTAGIDSEVISLQTDTPVLRGVHYLNKKLRLLAWFDGVVQNFFLKKRIEEKTAFSFTLFSSSIHNHMAVRNADVIYIHTVYNSFLKIHDLRKLVALNKPVYFVMHNMWNITGGCNYSFKCSSYKINCSKCPLANTILGEKIVSRAFRKKIQLYKSYTNIGFITPGKWLFNCTQEAALTVGMPVNYIPNVINTGIFKKTDKNTAKAVLNISTAKYVVAFGATNVSALTNGWSYLAASIKQLCSRFLPAELTVLIFGDGCTDDMLASIPCNKKLIGHLSDEYSLALVYNAADVIAVPDETAAFSYITMESLCCGTPVVGFDTVAMGDMIAHKKNGYLAIENNSDDFAQGLIYCIENAVAGYLPAELMPEKSIEKHKALLKND